MRLIYSYSAPCGDALLRTGLDPYPDGLLAQLADQGVNAVWLPALLYTLTLWEPDPQLSRGHQTRLENLRRLADRVARRGIGLYLYLNEPRALVGAAQREAFAELERVALAAYCHFRSVGLQIQFVQQRNCSSPAARRRLLKILDEEILLAINLLGTVEADSRIGFEAANHYSYTANDLREKVLNGEWLKKRLDRTS